MRKKMLVLSVVILVIAFCSVSFKEEPKYKNLKVLNKNITDDEMQIVMKQFKTALGVKCNFCHAASKTDPKKMDFASDENEHKDVARAMMRMTARINKKYFKDNKEGGITCYGCHRGEEEPKAPPKEVLEDR
jgi:Na+-translocating ferredoxin:NAD+ oxidoreductase RNF subunit RnfB